MEPKHNKQEEYDRKDHERLNILINKINKLIQSHPTILVIQCANIGSYQLQKIRKILRNEAEIIRGKVTHLRTAIRHQLPAHPQLKPLLQHLKGEIGLVFTNMDIWYIKNKIESETEQCEAKLNSRAPTDIIVPAGETDLIPSQTGYFAALNIPTKIMKGKIYFICDNLLFKKGEIITGSAYNLLCNLKMKPIAKHVIVSHAYINGTIIDEKTLNEAEERLDRSVHDGIQNIAAISIAIGAANQSSMMYILHSGLMNVRAVVLGMKEPRPEQFQEIPDLPSATHK